MPDLIRSIKTLAELPPILLICGEEEFLVEQAYKKNRIAFLWRNKFLRLPNHRCTRCYIGKLWLSNAAPILFVAEKRFVAVRNFETYFSGRKKSRREVTFCQVFKITLANNGFSSCGSGRTTQRSQRCIQKE